MRLFNNFMFCKIIKICAFDWNNDETPTQSLHNIDLVTTLGVINSTQNSHNPPIKAHNIIFNWNNHQNTHNNSFFKNEQNEQVK